MNKIMAKKKETAEEVKQETPVGVFVRWNGNERVYSLEVHGKDYRKLAQEFAGKVGGEVV